MSNHSEIKNIFLIGFMGSGKSYQGKLLSKHFGIPFIDLDKAIEEKMQKPIAQIFATKGEAFFRTVESAVLKETATKGSIVSCGGGTACYFTNMQWMNEHGVTIYLNPSLEIIFERLKRNKEKRPLIAEMSDIELKHFIKAKIAERNIFYNQCQYIITDENIDIDWFNKTILHATN